MPLIETTGSGSAKALGLNSASGPVNYIEDVFSTYLYTGNGSSQTITNGIDLSTKGGLVWLKSRSDATENLLYDTARGTYNYLISSTTGAQSNGSPTGVSSFNTTGFGVAGTTIGGGTNANGSTYASWTFRKQAKFFDIVTYTGDGTNARAISHNLGSVPGCIIVKSLNAVNDWFVYHRSLGATKAVLLNSTGVGGTFPDYWSDTSPTATQFTLGTSSGGVTNVSGQTYVAYLFAHNAGGFGTSGSDNVISCGSFTTDASGNATVNLGYEPQWVMFKSSSVATSWRIFDNMRGLVVGTGDQALYANNTVAETQDNTINPTSTGFDIISASTSANFVYIVIRRGPMKTPTSGTSVFLPSVQNTSTNATVTTNFPVDLIIQANNSDNRYFLDRLRGTSTTSSVYLTSNTTNAEQSTTVGIGIQSNTSFTDAFNPATSPRYYAYRRAPSFFDVVCYTGTNNDIALTHNLGVAPEAIILKKRNGAGDWAYETNFTSTQHTSFTFNGTIAGQAWNYSSGVVLTAQPTSTTVTVAGGAYSTSGSTYVMYLFASCPGVSKVGSYSGTGGTQTISCGFAARFVMIKRTDSTGSWWVWDTARGMVSGTDPRLALNSIAAETNANWVYTDASGFQIVTTDATVNASGGSYIYLAIA
jgi:hypothetical protein